MFSINQEAIFHLILMNQIWIYYDFWKENPSNFLFFLIIIHEYLDCNHIDVVYSHQ